MKVAVVRFPGTNCEFDTQYAFEKLGAEVCILWHKQSEIPKDTQLVVVPGGFSYGDYLRCGAIAQFSPIMKAIKEYALQGGRVHFISKMQILRVVNKNNIFLRSYAKNQEIALPIAHADGNYFIDESGLEALKANEQILLEYVDNPNGSVGGIAGVCNEAKNVFGLMPHPERAIEMVLGGCDGVAMLDNLLQKS